jgi:Leucine-rich repeat (LRR) protein
VNKVKPRLSLHWNGYTDSCIQDLNRVEILHLYQDANLCDTFLDVHELHIYSPVVELPHSIYKLMKLQKVNVSVNAMEIISPSFFTLVNLTTINFSCNRLGDNAMSGLCFLTNLQSLDLSYNHLTRLKLSLDKLEFLKVTGNSLVDLQLHGCTSLTTCIANFNLLDKIPCLPSLETIELIENKLTCITPLIGNCAKLRRLCLYRNQITSVSNCINLCPLFYLNLSQNDVREITLCISTLMDLYLDGNAFIKITFYNCHSLGILSLSHCFIYTIPSEWPSQTRNLTILNLDFNGLIELNGIQDWSRLKHLDLGYNCLTEIPICLKDLDYLNIACNYIKNVPNELKSIKKLIT